MPIRAHLDVELADLFHASWIESFQLGVEESERDAKRRQNQVWDRCCADSNFVVPEQLRQWIGRECGIDNNWNHRHGILEIVNPHVRTISIGMRPIGVLLAFLMEGAYSL